jgi:hypothetical protein
MGWAMALAISLAWGGGATPPTPLQLHAVRGDDFQAVGFVDRLLPRVPSAGLLFEF